MRTHGFVYILGNFRMPGLYKVGFTLQSPFERAEQLSRATGVPADFDVLGFVAFECPHRYERWMHETFAATRLDGTEFFQSPLAVLWEALSTHEDRQAVCDVQIPPWTMDEERLPARTGALHVV